MDEEVQQQRTGRHPPVQPATPIFKSDSTAQPTTRPPEIVLFDESGAREKFNQWMTNNFPKYDFDKFFRIIQNTMFNQLQSTLKKYSLVVTNDARASILNALKTMSGVEFFSDFIQEVKSSNSISGNNIKALEWYLNCYKDFLKEINQQ